MNNSNEEKLQKELFEYASVLRTMIQHENEITNHRLTWMLIFQSILFATSVSFWRIHLLLFIVIGLLGIFTSISFSYALRLSTNARVYFRNLWTVKIKDNKEIADKIPPIVGDPPSAGDSGKIKKPKLFRLRKLHPWIFIPRAMILCWLTLIILGIIISIKKLTG